MRHLRYLPSVPSTATCLSTSNEKTLDLEIRTREASMSRPLPIGEDLTTRVIGDFGKWQLMMSVLMAMLKLPLAWYQLNIIFMAPPQDYYCDKPPAFEKYSVEEWRKMCAPGIEEHPCLIYDPDILAIAPDMDRTMIPLVPCPRFVYDKSIFKRTIISDWGLICSKHWYIHLTQCIMMWGVLLGGIIFGILADKFGRKYPLMIAIVIQGLTSYIVSVLLWYWTFLVVWFILALASGGIGIISFVICMETVSGKWRTLIPVLYQLPFGLGTAIMAGLAYWFRDWRKLEFALATLSSLLALYWFFISESPRWLIATGQMDKALVVLVNAARQNGRVVNPREVHTLLRKAQSHTQTNPGFMAFLKSKNMRMRTMMLSLSWFCTGLSFYTFSQYLGSIGGNIFLVVAVSGIISTFGAVVCVLIVTRIGRKTSVASFQVVTAVCFISILMVPRNKYANDWPRLLFAGTGFAGLSGAIPALYLFSGELFPTVGRNVGLSGVTTFARVASMVAPLLVALDSITTDLPLMILSVISFVQIFLLYPLPETKDVPLPDTIEQAELYTH